MEDIEALLSLRVQQEREGRRRRPYPHPRILRPRPTYLDLTPMQVLRRYRLDSGTITELCDMLNSELESTTARSHAIPVPVKVTAALHFYATGAIQTTAGDRSGISQSSMSKMLTDVTNALYRRATQYIKFPKSEAEQNNTKNAFYQLAGFPNILGAIDCTHVALCPDLTNENAFRNRKHYHSINVQVVCDAHCVITDVVAKYPGGCHDSFILQNSGLFRKCEQGLLRGGWLLGDSSYPLKPWLMTPILNPDTEPETKYNCAHISTRNTIERCFGILKNRFRCLHKSTGELHYDPAKVCKIIVVCCMLHNIATQRGLEFALEHGEEMLPGDTDDSNHDEILHGPGPQERQIREQVIHEFFTM
ncbi:putative nuclease HARBI1 [Acipenser ruthenus]|uniref:putative nuclease HARBI1 n=1 Tax=Acipenser ruthenus TaxID=7906 RepID=UPI002741EBBB|nr:putative nuclease HARBI1 [Acipenser ruthenus]